MLINSYRFATAITYDTNAQTYITAVETADGESLETATRDAINAFVVGCKADGIWAAIKASCILAGARTLAGALTPLAGTAPTNVGGLFVAGDYNRKTGLKGNGSTKYLNSNFKTNQHTSATSRHIFTNGSDFITSGSEAFAGSLTTTDIATIEILNVIDPGPIRQYRSGNSAPGEIPQITSGFTTSGSVAGVRSSSTSAFIAQNGTVLITNTTSATPAAGNINMFVFGANINGSVAGPSTARLNFYSIGSSLSSQDVSNMHTRVTALITAISTAF